MRRFKYCTLLLFYPYHSDVSYLDSGLDPDKDFTDIKSTLDKALSGFIAEVGIDKIRHEKKVKGCYVCNHITKFPCLKQSAHDNGMEAWFAILQMRSIVRSQNDLLLPSSLQRMSVNMADTTDENVRAEFRAIQRTICTILWRDVCGNGGLFHYGPELSKAEIEGRLEDGCDDRTFNTLEGIRPFPPKPT